MTMALKRLAAHFLLFCCSLLQDVTSFALPPTSPSRLHRPKEVAKPFLSKPLHAITLPSWTYYSLAHAIGGSSGTPIVIAGTKKGSWFDRIPKPSINPPNFVFGPVWTVLYSLMGVSVSRIVKRLASTSSTAASSSLVGILASSGVLKLWCIHYTLNLLWAPIFFGLQRFRLGFIISTLLVLTLLMILPFYHAIDTTAAYLQIPYLMWLLFATRLNYEFCAMNPMDGNGRNEAMRQADMWKSGGEYTDVMLQNDIDKLRRAAAKYAGL